MLKGVRRGEYKPPRVVLYGPPGIGKSTFGADSDSPIIVPTEDGLDNVPVDQFEVSQDWAELLDRVNLVAKGNHDHKTVWLTR